MGSPAADTNQRLQQRRLAGAIAAQTGPNDSRCLMHLKAEIVGGLGLCRRTYDMISRQQGRWRGRAVFFAWTRRDFSVAAEPM